MADGRGRDGQKNWEGIEGSGGYFCSRERTERTGNLGW